MTEPTLMSSPAISTYTAHLHEGEASFAVREYRSYSTNAPGEMHVLEVIAGPTHLTFSLDTAQLRALRHAVDQRLAVVDVMRPEYERFAADAVVAKPVLVGDTVALCVCPEFAGESERCPIHGQGVRA